MLSKEQLLAISGLNLSGIVNKMDNNQFDEYCKSLLTFTEKFPVQETELKNSFSAKDYETFTKVLSGLHDMLEKIKATGLSQSSCRLLDELSTQKYKMVEAHLTYLLVEISELSIDIQVAWQKNKTVNEIAAKLGVSASAEKVGAAGEVNVQKNVLAGEDNVQKSVLAVDDMPLILNSLRLALNGTKYKLIGVKSGVEALRFTKVHSPDLFILDIEMPEMNGYELAKNLRSTGQTAPIIFLTGNSKQEYVVKAIEAGAVDFIVKPVNNEHVLGKIKKYIG